MDPVSAYGVFAGVVQVLQAIGSTVQGLNQLYGKFRDADLTIHSLVQELNCIGSALASLDQWTRINGVNEPQMEEYHQDLAVAMDGCRVIMEVVSHDVSQLVQSTHVDGLTSLRARLRVVWNEETMKGHQDKLHAQVNALQLLLQVCQCRSTAEQVRLLRTATTRRIIHRVADDTATLLSSRGTSYAGSMSLSSRASFSDQSLPGLTQTPGDSVVYQWLQQRNSTTGASEPPLTRSTRSDSSRSRLTDEGYSSSRTDATNLTIPPLAVSPQQQKYMTLPDNPSAPVHPGHSRSLSHTEVHQQPSPSVMRRHVSDSRASSNRLQASGSRLDKIKSSFLGRINTRSSANLARSPRISPISPGNAGSRRRRQRANGDPSTSIDLTSDDAALVPAIVRAAQTGSRDDVERLISRGTGLEARDPKLGRTALLVAAHCGRDDIVELLIQNNARVAVTDGQRWTALHLAASRGHCGVLELLVVESDLIEAQTPRGETALRIAADYDQPEAVQVLLEYHAQVNTRAAKLMTALHAAAKRGDSETAQLLASHGADLEAKDENLMTALHYACEMGHVETIQVLLNHRANIEALGRDRKTPLICAAEAGRTRAVDYLLQQKASFRTTDYTGMSALHWAAYNGHLETVSLFVKEFKKKGLLDIPTDNEVGRTALHLAVMQSHFPIVDLLQREGVSLDKRCKNGFTALHYACMAECFGVANCLLLTGANVEALESKHQERPLHIVAARGSLHLLDLLCDNKAALDVRNGFGDRPICVASRNGHVAIVQKLLDRGSPLTSKFNTGFREDSPLCLAATEGHLSVCSLLLSRGASAQKKDERGWQPLRCAAHHGHCDILQLLLTSGDILEADILDIMNMSEDIKFSSSVSAEKRRLVQALLEQALKPREPVQAVPPAHVAMPQAWSPHHSITRARTPPVSAPFAFEADSSTPQELPGSLDQDLTRSRPPTPEGIHRPLHPPSSRTIPRSDILRLGPNEAEPPSTNERSGTPKQTGSTSQPQSRPQRHSQSQSQSRPRRGLPQVYATYTPISIPPTPSPPIQPSQWLPFRTGNGNSLRSPSPPRTLSPDFQGDAAPIPRSLTTQENSMSGQHGEREDDDGSDSDSLCSVYTAPEGEVEAEASAILEHRSVLIEAT